MEEEDPQEEEETQEEGGHLLEEISLVGHRHQVIRCRDLSPTTLISVSGSGPVQFLDRKLLNHNCNWLS
jgi:hypothetical protein